MRYFGGKQRIARELATVIDRYQVQTYHEPFCGMFSVGAQVAAPQRSGADSHPDLILLLQAVQDGWIAPESVSEAEYEVLKKAEPSPLRAVAGFGGSHSAKFFAGYARGEGRNFITEARRSLMRLAPRIKNVRFTRQSYLDFDEPVDLIYCDPPYTGTTAYAVGPFDTSAFWQWVREYSRRSIVLVSEYTAPEWATVLWEKHVHTDMNAKDGHKHQRTEYLYLAGTN